MNEKLKIYGENGENQNQMNSSVSKNVLKVKDPKLSRVLIVQNNVYAAVHGAIAGFFHISKRRKTALQLNRTETLKPGEKKCSRHLVYVRACVNKDFVHSGSKGLI